MNEFDDFMGFTAEEMEEAEKDSGLRNLTAGTYSMMINSVTYMSRPKGGQAFAVDKPSAAGTDLSIEVLCILTSEQNGFGEGWKHTIFLRPTSTNEVQARISKALLSKLLKAANVPADNNIANALVGKIIEVELSSSTSKTDGKEYINVKDIRSVSTGAAKPAQKAADAGSTPDWGKKATGAGGSPAEKLGTGSQVRSAPAKPANVPDGWN